MNCWWKQTRWILIGIVLAGLVTDARALDPNRLPSQYIREQWTTETRFPGGAVNGIAQTADGYLWIGTDRGLLRFDGFNFKPVSFTSISTASNVPILQLLTDAGGNLWIRPQGAYLVRQKNGEFESVTYGQGAISTLSKDNHDRVLVSDLEQGIFRYTADHVQKLGPYSPPVISMAETADGKVWLGTLGNGLFFLTGGERATHVNAGVPDRKINSLLPIGEELWVGTSTGLYHGNGTGFRRLELPSFLGSVEVLSLLRDRDSNMWVGTTRGLLRINGKGVSFSEENELRGDGGINALFEDREGNLWIGSGRGLGRIRDSAFVTYSSVSDLRFEHNGPVYVDPEGRTWLAPAQGGLHVLQNGRIQPVTLIPPNEVVYSISGRADVVWVGRQRGGLTRLRYSGDSFTAKTYRQAEGLVQNSVYAVYESLDGTIWAGTLSAGVSKLKDGHFTSYTTSNGLTSNTVTSIAEGLDGTMWFGTPNGLSALTKNGWRTYTVSDGLVSQDVNCLSQDSNGVLWIGTSEGLAIFSDGHLKAPQAIPDSLHESVFGIAEDPGGSLWIATAGHVLQVKSTSLMAGTLSDTDVREYGPADGLLGTEGVKRSVSVVADAQGRVWFSTNRGLSVVRPSRETASSAIVHIEAVLADNTPLDLRGPLRIPPLSQRITFRYVGLSLSNSERVRYRYKLESFDQKWSEPIANREVSFTNLNSGPYVFRVIASNSDGLWNSTELTLPFTVEPVFWRTWWFVQTSLFLLGFAALALIRLRVHALARQMNMRFEARLAERTRIARDLHDTLLQSFNALLLRLQTVSNVLPARPDEAKKRIDSAIEQASQAIVEGRDAVHELRSNASTTMDLDRAVSDFARELLSGLAVESPPEVHVLVEGAPKPLNPIVRDELYRIVTETIRNAIRHANASRIEVVIRYDEHHLRLRIGDDGKGIDPVILGGDHNGGHWGLRGMRERATLIGGTLEIWSQVNSGTEIELKIPSASVYDKPFFKRWPILSHIRRGQG